VLTYALRRAALAVLVVWAVSLAVFVLLRVLPGDPALTGLGAGATAEAVARARGDLGLDAPLPVQYGRWIAGLARLDLGVSTLDGVSVAAEVGRRLPVTVELLVLTTAWTVMLGVPGGVFAARRRGTPADGAIRLGAVAGLAVPSFWVATLVLMLPQQWWGYAPPLDGAVGLLEDPIANLRQFLPPSLVLAAAPAATVARLTRTTLLEVLDADFVRTARAKGLAERVVVVGHALPNALIPVATLLGLQAGALLGGTIIAEQVFNLGGLGQYLLRAILQQDLAVAQTLVLGFAATAVLLNLAVDLSYGWLDPRVRRP